MKAEELAYIAYSNIVNRRTTADAEGIPAGVKILEYRKFEDLHPYEKEAWANVVNCISELYDEEDFDEVGEEGELEDDDDSEDDE